MESWKKLGQAIKPCSSDVTEAAIQSRGHIIDEISQQFGVGLLPPSIMPFSGLRDNVSCHTLDAESCLKGVTFDFREMKDWLLERDWLLSRQSPKNPLRPEDTIDYLLLAPAEFVEFSIGYHATRQCHLDSILESGLLPGTPERKNSKKRIDCEGNIYLCERLGSPTDAEKSGAGSAYWWCDHYSKDNRFNDPNWLILKVDLANIPNHQLVRDIWSESGVIVCGIDKIPANAMTRISMIDSDS